MTKLNDSQQELLSNVAAVKAQVDAVIAECREAFELSVERAKEPLFTAVAEAAAMRVPARQLGMVLGTSDHKTIKSYFPASEAK